MRILVLSLLASLLGSVQMEGRDAQTKGSYVYSLKRFEGKKSLVVVFATSSKDESFKKTQEALLGRYAEFRKQGLSVFYVFESEVGRADDMRLRIEDAADLRRTFKIDSGEFRVILIDKKGKLKRESKSPMSKEEIDKFLGL